MAYVTEDKKVKPIIKKLRSGEIRAGQARAEIGALTLGDTNKDNDGKLHLPKGRKAADPAFLAWEIEEAIKAGSGQGAKP